MCVPGGGGGGGGGGGISIHFKDFLKIMVQNLIFFLVSVPCHYNIWGGGGMPKFLIFFWGKQYICRCWVLANESTPALDIYLLNGKVKLY